MSRNCRHISEAAHIRRPNLSDDLSEFRGESTWSER